jgi:hypothetical protein
MVAPFNGLKSSAAFPATRKANNDITSITSNGGRVNCMQPGGIFNPLNFAPTQEAKEKELANGRKP